MLTRQLGGLEASVEQVSRAHKIVARVAQFPVSSEIRRNLEAIRSILEVAEPDSLVVLPEGALSGYDHDPAFVEAIDIDVLEASLRALSEEVARGGLHLVFGSCVHERGQWFNAGIYFGPHHERFVYRKVNLATHERGVFVAGSELGTFQCQIGGRAVGLGVQLCRDVRFPGQWQSLARRGAQVFVYLNNAVGDPSQAPVWRSHLISRAAENQRFLLGANNAHREQKCPSMIVTPNGDVLWEALSPRIEVGRAGLDLSQVSDWYLSQARHDLASD